MPVNSLSEKLPGPWSMKEPLPLPRQRFPPKAVSPLASGAFERARDSNPDPWKAPGGAHVGGAGC